MIIKTKRRRRKSRRAKTGIYVSTKTGAKCKYRSGWEKLYMEYLDNDPDVVDWHYEHFTIPYVSNKRSGKIRNYKPDMYVVRMKGKKQLIEIKPLRKTTQVTVVKKANAARAWCESSGVIYMFVTEIELKQLGLLI